MLKYFFTPRLSVADGFVAGAVAGMLINGTYHWAVIALTALVGCFCNALTDAMIAEREKRDAQN